MAFDKTEPQDTTKIRNLGTVIRPNWVAIQEGESTFLPWSINLANRTPIAPPDDPAAIANAFLLYCKDDALGNAELFGINESSNVVQFTKGASSPGSSGTTFIPGGVILKWGQASANGNTTITWASLGLSNFPTACWMVFAQPQNAGLPTSDGGYVYTANQTVAQFDALAVRRTTLASTAVTFKFLAIGN